MRRRDLLLWTGVAAFAAPASHAQMPGRVYRLGGLFPFSRDVPQVTALSETLAKAGFVEGRNVEWRGFELRGEQLPGAAAELVRNQADVILAGGDAAIRAAEQATATISILGITDDMVGSGLVASMSRPNRNITGISLLATELDGKRQELLIELMPTARKIAALVDIGTTQPRSLEGLETAARSRGIELSLHRVSRPEEISSGMAAAKQSGSAGVNVLASPILFAARQQIIEQANRLALPAIYQWPETAEEGGLIGYGPRIVEVFRDLVAKQLIQVLKGARPADLPVQQPAKFDLVINAKAAKTLGLSVPPLLLARADEVIE